MDLPYHASCSEIFKNHNPVGNDLYFITKNTQLDTKNILFPKEKCLNCKPVLLNLPY